MPLPVAAVGRSVNCEFGRMWKEAFRRCAGITQHVPGDSLGK
jgi:hypothetical protein